MAKKSFKADLANPAMQFISTPAETTAKADTRAEARAEAPEGYRVNPLYIEKRSKRLQMLIQPSLYDLLKGRADSEGCSVNDTLHRILEEALREEN